MWPTRRNSCMVLGLFVSSLLLALPIRSADAAGQGVEPKELVQAALESTFVGDLTERDRLLQRALEVDPECPEARWQCGFVKVGLKWLPVNQFETRQQQAGVTEQYRRLREVTPDTAEAQSSLAHW